MISEIKDRIIEKSQTEAQRERKYERAQRKSCMCDRIKWSDIGVIEYQKGQRKKCGRRNVSGNNFWKIFKIDANILSTGFKSSGKPKKGIYKEIYP